MSTSRGGTWTSASAPPQVIGHEMSGIVAEVGPSVAGFEVGDAVVVRPLDARGEVPADRGSATSRSNLRFLGIDVPGAFQLLDRSGVHAPQLPLGTTCGWPLSWSRSPSLATSCGVRAPSRRDGRRRRRRPDRRARRYCGGSHWRERDPCRGRSQRAARVGRELGLRTSSTYEDLSDIVPRETYGAGADVVFEASARKRAPSTMTR